MSVEAFSSKTNCDLLSVANVSQTSSHSDGCGVVLNLLCPAVLNSLINWCRRKLSEIDWNWL